MGFIDFFRHPFKSLKETKWKELGAYTATFVSFGTDIFENDTVRACVRALANHTSKANAVSKDERIANLLNIRPNMYMNGKAFLWKVRAYYELKNNAFIYIQRNDKGKATGFYPVPYQSFEAIESAGRLFIKFFFAGEAARNLVIPWDDLAVLRKDYVKSDIAGDDNGAIIPKLELICTSEQGIANAVKSTANLRGIIKSTKAMLSPAQVKQQKEEFVRDYMNLENSGGIASLDASQEFTPITMSPTVTSTGTLKEFREDIYRYFGVNDHIIMGSFSEEEMEAFYDSQIEPFLVELGTELTGKVYTGKEPSFGNYIIYESNRIQYASTKTKLAMVAMVDRGALVPNEWRAMFNLAPVEGGDKPIRRLDTQTVDSDKTNSGSEEGGEDEN